VTAMFDRMSLSRTTSSTPMRRVVEDQTLNGSMAQLARPRTIDISEASTKKYCCPEPNCRKSYTRSNKLKCHIASAHEGKKPFKCLKQDCSMEFSNKQDHQRHMGTHQPSESRVPCERCGQDFSRRDYLLEHKRKRCSARSMTTDEEMPTSVSCLGRVVKGLETRIEDASPGSRSPPLPLTPPRDGSDGPREADARAVDLPKS
jgi:hypothetical protein